ncbi:MAG TPA: GNAT family N-acetyltransferase [Chthoniobacterales bacterium]
MDSVSPVELDSWLAGGWRHFGSKFFRYNFAIRDEVLCGVMPLRLPLEAFSQTKSQRRVWKRNSDLDTRLTTPKHSREYDDLFVRHKSRFVSNVPDSLRDFLSDRPAEIPTECVAVELRLDGTLVAASFFDLASESASSIYAMFDPDHGARSLGIHTLLVEIEHARALGKKFLYLGYAYTVPSAYDYKKGFPNVEAYDWGNGWLPLPQDFSWSRKVDLRRGS